MKKALFALTAMLLCLLLCGCGGKDTPSETAKIPTPPMTTELPATTEQPSATTAVPTEEPEAPAAQPSAEPVMADTTVAAGVYTYETADAVWTLTLRESGPYTLQKAGDIPHTGEAWVAEADGTVSCGPTDLWTESFADANGCSRWILYLDGRCEPMIPG